VTESVSPKTLERLVARALELDERRNERISLSQAREIAKELGISESAWDAAVSERRRPNVASGVSRNVLNRLRLSLVGTLAVAAGALGGWLNRVAGGDADIAYGLLLVLGGVELWSRLRKESPQAAEVSLDIWWLGIPAGMFIAFGGIRTDPLWFAVFARWGTAAAVHLAPRLLRRWRANADAPSAAAGH
jgi:hypothetical protein